MSNYKDFLRWNRQVGNTLGEQTIRLLGPFHVAHDDTGIDADGLEVATGLLPEGSSLIVAWPILTEALDSAGDPADYELIIGFGAANQGLQQPLNATIYGSLGSTLTTVSENGVAPYPFSGAGRVTLRPALCLTISSLFIFMFDGGQVPLTAGEADIYALIAEPV